VAVVVPAGVVVVVVVIMIGDATAPPAAIMAGAPGHRDLTGELPLLTRTLKPFIMMVVVEVVVVVVVVVWRKKGLDRVRYYFPYAME